MLPCAKRTSLPALLAVCLFVVVLGTHALRAQQQNTSNENNGYPVTVGGEEVFRIYENVGSFSAEQRANAASQRYERLVYDRKADLANITTVDSPNGTSIILGENVLLVVTDQDAQHYHSSRQATASLFAKRIRDAVGMDRWLHSRKYLVRAAIYGAVTLAVYLLLVWLVVAGTRKLLVVLRPAAARIKGIKIQQSELLAGDRIAAMLMTGVRLLRVVLLFLFTWIFLATEFNYFPWTRGHGRQLLNYIVNPITALGRALVNYLPNLFYIIVIVTVMYYVARFIRRLASEVEGGNIRISGFYPEWAQPTYKIIRFLLIAFTGVIVYPYLPGENSPAFKGVGIFIGVLFSLGSTSAVANVVAGVILIYARGFRVGDWVKIGDNLGEVTSQTMLATHMKTIKNEEIILPNSVVLGSYVTNYSMLAQTQGLILHTSVTIGYDAPWRKVHELLIEAALKTKYILPSPAPFVLQTALQDSYVQYEINAYTDQPLEMVNIYSELHSNIQDCFYAGGVEIMSPIYSALRDGNKVAIPGESLPADYRPGGFRIARDDASAAGAGKS